MHKIQVFCHARQISGFPFVALSINSELVLMIGHYIMYFENILVFILLLFNSYILWFNIFTWFTLKFCLCFLIWQYSILLLSLNPEYLPLYPLTLLDCNLLWRFKFTHEVTLRNEWFLSIRMDFCFWWFKSNVFIFFCNFFKWMIFTLEPMLISILWFVVSTFQRQSYIFLIHRNKSDFSTFKT